MTHCSEAALKADLVASRAKADFLRLARDNAQAALVAAKAEVSKAAIALTLAEAKVNAQHRPDSSF